MADWFFSTWPLWVDILVFLFAAATIAWIGPRLVKVTDVLGDRLGLGDALAGAILLGMSTSLAGITAVATAGWRGNADLAVATCFGGIIAQTSFLVVADFIHPRHNLEADIHTSDVMMTGSLLIGLIGLALMAIAGPDWSVWQIHPATVLLPGTYLVGINIVDETKETPGWRTERPREAIESPEERAEEGREASTAELLRRYTVYVVIVSITGWLLAHTGDAIGGAAGLDDSLVGSLLVGQATSLPELVTVIAAVRLSAPALAVSNIIGGNAFDVLFLTVGDIFYRGGSIYHAVADQSIFLGTMGILATTALLMGLIHRKRFALLTVGFEEAAIFAIYVGGFAVLFVW